MIKKIRVSFNEDLYKSALNELVEINLPELQNVLDSYENDIKPKEDFSNDLLQRLYNEGPDLYLNEYQKDIENQIKGFAQVIQDQLIIEVKQKANLFRSTWNKLSLNIKAGIYSHSRIFNTTGAFIYDAETKTFHVSEDYKKHLEDEVFSLYAVGQDIEIMNVFNEIYDLIEKHKPTLDHVRSIKKHSMPTVFGLLEFYSNKANFAGVSNPVTNPYA